jgi:hypothetical protein
MTKKHESGKNIPVEPKEQVAPPSRKLLAGEELLTLQMFLCTPDVDLEVGVAADKNVVKLREVAKVGSFSLYNQLKPQDPAEAMLAALSIQVNNATAGCFFDAAANRAYPEIRHMNLRDGFEGAGLVVTLLDALRRRRQEPKSVTVGNVNVEAGGQAIVGHVETGGQEPKADNSQPGAAPEAAKEAGE